MSLFCRHNYRPYGTGKIVDTWWNTYYVATLCCTKCMKVLYLDNYHSSKESAVRDLEWLRKQY